MLSKVLVPLDGTETSEGILPYISQLAQGLDISVIIMTAVDPASFDFPENMSDLIGPWEKAIRERLAQIEKNLQAEGIKAELRIANGRAQTEILRIAEDEGCDLIAMSSHGRGIFGWGFLGSTAYSVIHSTKIPTLIIAPKEHKESDSAANISTISLALDGSPLAELALPYVEYLAQNLNSEIQLIRAVSTGRSYPSILARLLPPNVDEQAESEAKEYLQGISDSLIAKGLKVTWKIARGNAANSIVATASEAPNNLTVLTTHGVTGFNPRRLGSVSIGVIRESEDPVLIIPPREGESR